MLPGVGNMLGVCRMLSFQLFGVRRRSYDETLKVMYKAYCMKKRSSTQSNQMLDCKTDESLDVDVVELIVAVKEKKLIIVHFKNVFFY